MVMIGLLSDDESGLDELLAVLVPPVKCDLDTINGSRRLSTVGAVEPLLVREEPMFLDVPFAALTSEDKLD